MNNEQEKIEVCEMPLTWPERLDKLEVGESETIGPEDSKITASMACVRMKKSTGKVFKIRTNRKTGESRAWRTK